MRLENFIKDTCDYHNQIIVKNKEGKELSILQNNEGCSTGGTFMVYGDTFDGTVEVWDRTPDTEPVAYTNLDELITMLQKFRAGQEVNADAMIPEFTEDMRKRYLK